MMFINYKTNFYKFFIYSSILLITLAIVSNFIVEDEKKDDVNTVISSNITYSDELTSINVDYPRFKINEVDKIITNYIYSYVKNFKTFDKTQKILDISYQLYYFDNYVNIVFNIENSIDSNIKYKNILINLDTNELSYISSIYDKDYLSNEINTITYNKYSKIIYDLVSYSNVDNHTYIISDDTIIVYFNDIKFNDIDYIPYITISFDEKTNFEEQTYDENEKLIAFTFDDGPSDYTLQILDTLEANAVSATFFMLGNKMKYLSDTVNKIYESNSEVASHTYSHKYLTKLSNDEILNEVNSTSILFNEITDDYIKYVRPPYGSINSNVKSLIEYPIILWNIDTKDWLVRDADQIYNNIISSACDGCIVLMHDTYKETLEAVKMSIPALRSMGYEIVSISKLFELYNYTPKNGEVIRNIK